MTHTTHLAPEVDIIDSGVWMEGDAIEQLKRVATFPGCCKAVGMPDMHAGPGIPIGAAFDFEGIIRPALVGSDAGCGARVMVLSKARKRGQALERRARRLTDRPPLAHLGGQALLEAAWHHGPKGLLEVGGIPDTLAALAEVAPPEVLPWGQIPSGPCPTSPEFGHALGTIGGGNHFLEAGEVTPLRRADRPGQLGLRKGQIAIIAHSGSRGLGAALARRWGDATLEGADITTYLKDLAGAIRFAQANRLVLCWLMMKALGVNRPEQVIYAFDVVHNAVVPDGHHHFIHRKGAAPAPKGAPTVVLGSRGAESWIMEGRGNHALLSSVAHGAGRRMARKEAVAKLKGRYRRQDLRQTPSGGRVICDDQTLLLSEHPDAYKDIESVVAALELAQCARRVASITPKLTVKR